MEELCTRDRHQQPAAEPPRAIIQPALRVHNIIEELQAPRSRVDCHSQPKLVLRADPQSETRRACAHGRGKARRQRTRDARVSFTERFGIIGTKIRSNSDEKTVKKTMEQEQERQGKGEAEVGRAEERGAGFLPKSRRRVLAKNGQGR